MKLKDANKQLERLDNDYDFYLKEKEEALNLVMPKATDIREEIVDGGKRSDRLLEYAEMMDAKKIDETLEYISRKKNNLINWINEELRIMGKYGEIEALIVELKENIIIKDDITNKYRHLTWEEVGKRIGYHKDHCRKIYRLYKKRRTID